MILGKDKGLQSTSIESTPMWLDVMDIIRSAYKAISFSYRATIHTPKGDIPVISITSMDVVRNYTENIGDEISIELVIPLGTYMFKLFPFKDNLEITIRRSKNLDLRDGSGQEPEIVVERYKAVFNISENPEGIRPDLMILGIDALDISEIVDVKLQLLDRALEPLRMKTTSGIFRDVTQEQILRTILPEEFDKVEVDGLSSIDGLDIVEPDNTEPRETVLIEDGTSILMLPTFLQEKSGGLYSSGVASYLQRYKGRRIFFIYPPLDLERHDDVDRTLMVYYVPENKLRGIERTFVVDGEVVKIIATGEKKYVDSGDVGFMNKGSGFRAANQEALINKPVEITPEGVVADRTSLTHEIVIKERDDGFNHAPMLPNRSTANLYRDVSALKQRGIAKEQFVWENADYDLIYPGMPVTVMMADRDEVKESRGIVESVQVFIERSGPVYSNTYHNVCSVTVLVEPKRFDGDLPEIPIPEYSW